MASNWHPDGESNPGLPRDKLGYLPLYYDRSKINAVSFIIDQAVRAAKYLTYLKHLCVVIALDVRNALNSAPWPFIDEVRRRKEFSPYINRICAQGVVGWQ